MAACLSAITREFSSVAWLSALAGVALVSFTAIQWAHVNLTYRIFAILALSLGLGLWLTDKVSSEDLALAIDRSAFFTFFLTSLAVLRESAKSSPLVRRCGTVLVNQPPGRRYLLLSFGSHLFSVMLNIGALNVLGTMVRGAVRPGHTPEEKRIAEIRLRRMLTATLRGFCAVPLWAPTSVTMLLVLSGIPDLTWEQFAPLGLLWAGLFILLGAILDRVSYPQRAFKPSGNSNLAQLIPLVILVALIPSVAYMVSRLADISLFSALLMCAPVIGVAWLFFQYGRCKFTKRLSLLGRRITRSFPATFTNQRNEVVLFASSGFIGVILIPLIDPQAASSLLVQAGISGAGLMILVSMIMLVFAFIGVNAIITVTLMLGILQQLPNLEVSAMVQASVISITWGLFAGASPFTASLRFISAFSGVSALRLGVGWNGPFSLGVLAIMYLALFLYL